MFMTFNNIRKTRNELFQAQEVKLIKKFQLITKYQTNTKTIVIELLKIYNENFLRNFSEQLASVETAQLVWYDSAIMWHYSSVIALSI